MVNRDTFPTTVNDGDTMSDGWFTGISNLTSLGLANSVMSVSKLAANTDYNDANDIMIMLSSTRWIAFDDSAKTFFLTVDAGSNWIAKKTGIAHTMLSFYVNPHDTDYITFFSTTYNEEAYYSTDAGLTWTAITVPAGADQNKIAYSITTTGRIYVVYDDGGTGMVDYSDNGGTAWTNAFSPSSNPVDIADIASPKNNIVAYATDDSSVSAMGYTLDNGSAVVEQTSGNTSDGVGFCFYHDSSNYQMTVADGVGGVGGVHIIVVGGITISSSATATFSVANKVLRSASDRFIYYNASRIYHYDATAILTILPLLNFIADLYYHGVSATANEDRLMISKTEIEQQELWTGNRNIQAYES